jgi:hypothetical protein
MAQEQRTKKYIRNWSEYSERLVKRGEIYINLDFLENWDKEIEEQNAEKRGRPYIYPEAFIRFSAIIYEIFHLPYRQMEGFYRKLSQYVSKIKAADYTTLFRRIQKVHLEVPESYRYNAVIAIDSTGIKVTNRGEWLREKWKIHRGWLKVHIAVDIRTKKILGIEVTDERVSDSRMFKNLISQAEKKAKIEKVLADGAYDTREIFNLLEEKHIESGIKIRKNANQRARGSPYRKKCVRELKEMGYERWKEKHDYGKRWAVEGVFSSVKRIFGESVRAHSQISAIQEAKRKFMIYNMLLNS